MKNTQKGFSLIELLIVVAIIGIIAAIAIPSLIKARAAANEASAIGTLRTFGSAEATAMSTNNNVPLDIAQLAAGRYIDEAWAPGQTRSSYIFTGTAPFSAGLPTSWVFSAEPDGSLTSGSRSFSISEDFTIRYQSGATAPGHGTVGTVLGTT